MKKNKAKCYFKNLSEKHIPLYFIDYQRMNQILNAIFQIDDFGRRELLLFLYIIGANSEESDILLQICGYTKLYVKNHEDAIWKFALDNRTDCNTIINNIFPQSRE